MDQKYPLLLTLVLAVASCEQPAPQGTAPTSASISEAKQNAVTLSVQTGKGLGLKQVHVKAPALKGEELYYVHKICSSGQETCQMRTLSDPIFSFAGLPFGTYEVSSVACAQSEDERQCSPWSPREKVVHDGNAQMNSFSSFGNYAEATIAHYSRELHGKLGDILAAKKQCPAKGEEETLAALASMERMGADYWHLRVADFFPYVAEWYRGEGGLGLLEVTKRYRISVGHVFPKSWKNPALMISGHSVMEIAELDSKSGQPLDRGRNIYVSLGMERPVDKVETAELYELDPKQFTEIDVELSESQFEAYRRFVSESNLGISNSDSLFSEASHNAELGAVRKQYEAKFGRIDASDLTIKRQILAIKNGEGKIDGFPEKYGNFIEELKAANDDFVARRKAFLDVWDAEAEKKKSQISRTGEYNQRGYGLKSQNCSDAVRKLFQVMSESEFRAKEFADGKFHRGKGIGYFTTPKGVKGKVLKFFEKVIADRRQRNLERLGQPVVVEGDVSWAEVEQVQQQRMRARDAKSKPKPVQRIFSAEKVVVGDEKKRPPVRRIRSSVAPPRGLKLLSEPADASQGNCMDKLLQPNWRPEFAETLGRLEDGLRMRFFYNSVLMD